jgi:hypothetical protein
VNHYRNLVDVLKKLGLHAEAATAAAELGRVSPKSGKK